MPATAGLQATAGMQATTGMPGLATVHVVTTRNRQRKQQQLGCHQQHEQDSRFQSKQAGHGEVGM